MGLEIVIERWQRLDGKTDFRWSAWHDGKRIQMGGAFADIEACEGEAQQFCRTAFGRPADRVTRL